MKNKRNLQFYLSALITVCFWLIAFVFCIVEEDRETNRWFFDWTGALRVVPFLCIYTCIGCWLFPKYLKDNKLGKFLALSGVVVVVIISLWAYLVSPIFPVSHVGRNFEPDGKPQLLFLGEREQKDLVYMIDNKNYNGSQILSNLKNDDEIKPNHPPHSRPQPPFFISLLIGFFVFAFFTAKSFIFKMIKTENEKKELEKLKAEAELKLFRYQLNPHFLMNTLNNIHALIDIDGKAAQDSVRILSKMMRYMLYDSNHEKVELYKEIDFLQNYFELMRKRYIAKVEITFIFPETIPTILIPPALFINLVENSFKHGISYMDNSFIYCEIAIIDDYVVCDVRNSNPRSTGEDKKESGYGLDINKKRLDIIYPNRYYYTINDTANEYRVELKIPVV